MFKRKLKIKQITACCNTDFFYTVGLGNDGKVYLWDKRFNKWVPHYEPIQEAPNDNTAV